MDDSIKMDDPTVTVTIRLIMQGKVSWFGLINFYISFWWIIGNLIHSLC